MSKAKVLFFAADPLSLPGEGAAPRLRLDEDVRQIQRKVRASEYREELEFDFRWAARTDDLIQALEESPPQVVHFSGHGGTDGLIFVSRDGSRPQPVSAPALEQLFRAFRGDIRLVVLSACFSRPQAQAIAGVVGCAIGTRGTISDEAAITFAGAFYRAVAFGHSVRVAFDRARAALALEHYAERDCPELITGPGVDADEIVLIPRPAAAGPEPPPPPPASKPAAAVPGRSGEAAAPGAAVQPGPGGALHRRRHVFVAVMALGLSSAAVWGVKGIAGPSEGEASTGPGGGIQTVVPQVSPTVATVPENTDLARGKSFHAAGNYEAAIPFFEKAMQGGSAEAMAWLGTAYLNGEGVMPDTVRATALIKRAAEARDAFGMNARGLAFQDGAGEEQSNRWAGHWFRAAAEEKAYVPAMRNLGHLLVRTGTDSSYAEALAWYGKAAAAEEGAASGAAMADIGKMFENGWGVPLNTDSALHWYRRAADAGAGEGMVRAGSLYQDRGDYASARQWYERGIQAGSADAKNNMAVLFYHGLGVRRDRHRALRLFREAAEAGSAMAAGNVALHDG